MTDAIIYFVLIGLWSAVAAYVVIFRIAPSMGFGPRPAGGHGAHAPAHEEHHPPTHKDPMLVEHHAPMAGHPAPAPAEKPQTDHRRSFSAYEGFRSFATGPELTVEDIVKGLSRK